jgi:phospholipid transport system substrate-binding protein
MLYRRHFLTLTAGLVLTSASFVSRGAWAQGVDQASAFVKTTGDKLVGVVNGPGTAEQKRHSLTQIIDNAVDIDGVARFCLGRYWRQASPDQQKRFLDLFHQVLVINITSKLGEYQGVRFTMGRSRQQDDETIVSTTVERPNNPPTAVDWVVAKPGGKLQIIDVIAEGTSLRLTQRSDYASYLARTNNNIDALISAMRQQVAQNG